jgi:quercetin dioxygenase-like cupin family protein
MEKKIQESKPFFIGTEEKIYNADKGITRQFVGYDDSIMMVKVMFEKGAIGTPHAHPHAQTTYVVSGKFETTIGKEVKILEAGDGFYIEPDMLHGCICLEAGTLIDVFTPIREDFYATI